MSLTELMRGAMQRSEPGTRQKKAFDAAAATEPSASADLYTMQDIAMKAAASIQQWAETDNLDDGETYSDRLLALMVGIADLNKDGEITDDEQEVVDTALNAAWDYLTSKGVADEDAGALLNDWDADAGERVRELIAANLPEGDEAGFEDIDSFVFGTADQEPAFDAVYKMKMAVRGGKKVRIKKRISGTVRLKPGQKMAIRKAQMKSHSAGAQMKRAKSMRMRGRMGM